MNPLFPSEDESLTPLDFVPKLSNVACVIQCTGLWIGGKGWGLTWKLVQAIVKPRETQTVFGKCHVMLSNDEMKSLSAGGSAAVDDGEVEDEIAQVKVVSKPAPKSTPTPTPAPAPVDTAVEDSDDESEIPPPPALSRQNAIVPDEPVPAPEPTPAVTEEITEAMVAAADVTVPSPAKTVVKKIVKKKVTPA
jgi:hypothetical protein